VKRQSSIVNRQSSIVKRETSNLKRQTSNIKHQTLKHQKMAEEGRGLSSSPIEIQFQR
jgi:hypothetical protein